MIPEVLIIDDSPDIRMIVCAYLEQWQVELTEACSGKVAISLFSEREFNLVFVDLIMPDMDGAAVVAEIRKIEASNGRHPACIVALSGSVDRRDWQAAADAGINAQLPKPISHQALSKIMHQLGIAER